MTETMDPHAMDTTDASPSSSLAAISILRWVHEQRNANGLRQQDYPRYRKFCSSQLQKLRKSCQLTHKSKGPYKRKTITQDLVREDAQSVLIPLVEAERAWAYAQELRVQSASTGEPRQRYHQVRRLRKAIQLGLELFGLTVVDEENVLLTGSDQRLDLESLAYVLNLGGLERLAVQDWQAALELLVLTRQTLTQLIGVTSEAHLGSLCRAFTDELDPQIRYCAYKLRLSNELSWGEFSQRYYQEHSASIWSTVETQLLSHAAVVSEQTVNAPKEDEEAMVDDEPSTKPTPLTLEMLQKPLVTTRMDTSEGLDSTPTADLAKTFLQWHGHRATPLSLLTVEKLTNAITVTASTLGSTQGSAEIPPCEDLTQRSQAAPSSFLGLLDLLMTSWYHLPAAHAVEWPTLSKAWLTAVKQSQRDLKEQEVTNLKVRSLSSDEQVEQARLVYTFTSYHHALCHVYRHMGQLLNELFEIPASNSTAWTLKSKALAVDNEALGTRRRNDLIGDMVKLYNLIIHQLSTMVELPGRSDDREFIQALNVAIWYIKAQRCILVACSYDVAQRYAESNTLYDHAMSYLTRCKSQTMARGHRSGVESLVGQLGFMPSSLGPENHGVKGADYPQIPASNILSQMFAWETVPVDRWEKYVAARKLRARAAWSLQQSDGKEHSNSSESVTEETLVQRMLHTLTLNDGQETSNALRPVVENLNEKVALLEPSAFVQPVARPVKTATVKPGAKKPNTKRKQHTASQSTGKSKPLKTKPNSTTSKVSTSAEPVPYVADFPPRFQALPYKPMLFDLAGTHIDVPMDTIRQRAGQQESVLGGLKGVWSNIWSR
ncbi:signal recognition particle subunit srp68 [Dispira parvispora]|uniref:Signal recognition particle subunit SRP68 n=1 Tax=Dispira parvispora TaxID=1520584 RepID=A0A9W8AK96_9FUNG|nr:signal recognition particle subunit srp68 [Dispira parvispora]